MPVEKEYVCAYKHCLHKQEKVKASEAVVINKRRYHWDCAAIKQEIADCVRTYMSYINDKTQYPMVVKIINSLVFNDRVPVEFIKESISNSKMYYKDKPPFVLYGLKKKFWFKFKE